MANQKITLNASQSPAMTNQVGFIPITSRNFSFGALLASGRDLQLYDSDQSTPIAHSLRTWGTGGLRLIDRTAPPSSADPLPYIFAVATVTGTMGFGADPHTIRSWGSGFGANGTIPAYGLWRCYDATGALIWTFQTANHDYPMSTFIADVDGDGVSEVIVGTRRIDHRGYVLNGTTGTVRWSWDLGASASEPLSNGSYCRISCAGNMRTDLAGLEVLHGGSDGKLRLADKDGNEIFSIVLTQPNSNQSVQDALIDDLTGSGTNAIYCVQGEKVRKVDNTGTVLWTYTHARLGAYFNNYYAISSGHITSTTTKQLVACSATQDGTSNLGVCTVLDSAGAVAWEKVVPYRCYSVGVGDVNGDGYDEVLLTFGTNGSFTNGDGWGGLLVLDRDGVELSGASFGSSAKNTNFGDTDGDGIPEILVACDDGYQYRYAWDSIGATVKATIPSISAASTRDLWAAGTGSTTLPPLGDYYFDLSGADGATPTGWTQRLGAWTIQGGTLQSPDDGDTAGGIRCAELTGSSTDGLEAEYDAGKPGQGTGSSVYYTGFRYRCVSWSAGLPVGYYVQTGNTGVLQLQRTASGTATPAVVIVSIAVAAAAFNATDVMRYRVVASGDYHSLAYRKNGSAWKLLYETSDVGGPTAAGSVALTSNRGQSRYSGITLLALPSVFGNTFAGPSPVYIAATANAPAPPWFSLTPPTPPSGVVGVPSGPFQVAMSQSFTGTVTITPSGGGLTAPIVLTFSSGAPQSFTITPSAPGTITLTASNSGGLTNPGPVVYTATGVPVATTSWPYMSTTAAFPASSAALMGYTVYGPTGAIITPRATTGIVFIGNLFVAQVSLPWTGGVLIDWSDGTTHDVEALAESFAEPGVPTQSALAEALALATGRTSNGGLTFYAPDGVTPRLVGTVADGDRTSSILYPPA